MLRKIGVVTGTRADYGLLFWVLKAIQTDADLELQLIVTGMHLSPEYGLTFQEIEADGFPIAAKVEMLMSSDTPVGITKSMGLGAIAFADVLARLHPDILLVLGDRYEIFAAAQAALIARIPLAHIAGGDTTAGAFDEALRHSISKMAHFHFTTNSIATHRLRQLGENPAHIYQVGSPGIDRIHRLKPLSKQELAETLNFHFKPKNILITYHPATLESQPVLEQFCEILRALDCLGDEIGLIFTKPNSDTAGKEIASAIDDYVRQHSSAVVFTSLGSVYYLSTIACVDLVLGNSSSGLYEVPSFKIPTVNIGDRQKGRLQATSVLNCQPVAENIVQTIQQAFETDCSQTINPYGEGNSSEKIIKILKEFPDPKTLLKKHFFDLEF